MIRAFLKGYGKVLILVYLTGGSALAVILWISHEILGVADVLSLGQLIVEFLLLPAAMIGLLIAVEEFRSSGALPKLDLWWMFGRDKYEKTYAINIIPEMIGHPEEWPATASLAVINTGNSVAEWFVVEFKIPFELSSPEEIEGKSEHWHGSVGGEDSWHVHWTVDYLSVSFMSNGRIASYPGLPLELGSVALYAYQVSKEKYQIEYNIVTNKGKPKAGSLLVSVIVGH
jgi:hypothetical protein